MENPADTPSMMETFTKGFLKSAKSGALMSSIYYGLGFVLKAAGWNLLHLGAPGAALAVMGFMVAAVGIFGGVMAVMQSREAREEERAPSQTIGRARSHEHARAPEVTPVLLPTMAADRVEGHDDAPQQSWVERTSNDNRRTGIEAILARGDLSDKDRASAILASREAEAANAVNAR